MDTRATSTEILTGMANRQTRSLMHPAVLAYILYGSLLCRPPKYVLTSCTPTPISLADPVYGGDPVRSLYALGMGIASAVTVLFFAVEAALPWQFFGRHLPRRLASIFHSFTFFSSTLVMIITILNLLLVFRWRNPHGSADSQRSIQGRCSWDLDVVWSGTGMACSHDHAMTFGKWLGAAISRLIISAVLLVRIAGHFQTHRLMMGGTGRISHGGACPRQCRPCARDVRCV